MKKWIGNLAIAGWAVVMLAVPVMAQLEQATVVGSVKDASGAVIPEATLTVRNIDSGVAVTIKSNSLGYYRVPYLQPGRYEVLAESVGFKKARVSGVILNVGLTATVDFVMEVGSVETEIAVTATAVQIEEQTSTLGNVVGSRQIAQLPLLGRNPYSLVALAPGVIPKAGSASGVTPIISGGRSNTSEVLLDGAESRNSTTQDIAYAPPLETVQEFKLLTNNFSAEFGRSGGGVITAATRSGTNELHGSLYEFLRNDKLNANSWVGNQTGLQKSPFRRNEYGFSVGGPVWVPKVYDGRNRTFFFLNWEQVPQRNPDDLRDTVPTLLERAGDFSQTRSGNTLIRIFDPGTTRPDPSRPGRFIRDQFPGNRIPASRIHPIARNVIQFYPEPNRSTPTQNFVLNQSRKNDVSRLFFRFDHNIGTKHRLFLSHGRETSERFTVGINEAYPGEGTNGQKGFQLVEPRMATLSDTVMFSSSLIGEFRATLVRNVNQARPRSVGYDFTQLGFSEALKKQAKQLIFPRFVVNDVAALGPDRASFFHLVQWNSGFQAHFTFVRAAHSVKWGTDYTFFANNVTRPEYGSGLYNFARTFTQGPDPATSSATAGFGVATLLLGAPTGGQMSDDPSVAASQRYYSAYLQDDWRIRPDLTLNLGIRWEYQTPWTERFNQLGFFDPEFPDPLTKQTGLLRFVGVDGNSRFQTRPDRNNFAPRLGLAWRFAPKSVVRAGYGMFYFPGSGGIGGGIGDLGSGFSASTGVFLGPPPAAPNTPPTGGSLSNPFVAGFFRPPSSLVGSSVGTPFPNWVTPYNQQWNFSVQRMAPGNILVEAAYLGSRGQRIWINRSRSAVSTKFLELGPELDTLVPNPYRGIITTGALSAPTLRRSVLLQPFNHYTNVSSTRDPIGDSVYHGFTLRVDKETAQGLKLQASYTVSKMIDNVQERFGGRSSFIDPNNLRLSRSISEWDRPQYLVINYIYMLPWGQGRKWISNGLASRILGVWQVSGITTFGKGQPAVISAPSNTRLPGVSATAVRLRSAVLPDHERSIDRWFDTSAFLPAPTYSLGSDSRTQPDLRGPGIKRFDISLSRSQRIRERVDLQFRAEFFDAFNTPQFNDPNMSLTSRDFGRILGAGGARQIQLGLRMTY